ncbi:MAG: MFS transporter [candidate division WOR-3 bacterium]|nr:MFS transporter [candidate division WOR-3 bacterium]
MQDTVIKKALRISILQGLFTNIHITLTGGMFLTGFALYLKASAFHIGLLAAIPALLTSFGFVSAFLVNRLSRRKPLTVVTSGIGRALFFILAVLLLFNVTPRLSHLLVIIGVFNALLMIADNAWLSWMSDLVPKEMRGRFFGIRNTAMGLIGMAVSFSGAKLLDYFKATNQHNFGFGIIFLIASLCALVGTILLSQQPEISMVRQPTNLRAIISAPFKDTNFRKFLRFVGFWYITSSIASPFYLVFMLQNLRMQYSTVAIYSIIAGIVTFIFQPLWGKAIDRFQSKPILFINFFSIAFLPLLWIFPTANFLLPVWIDAFLTGIFWSGVNLSVFNILFSLSDNEELKESYFAIFAAVTGISGFVSSLLGGYLANLLKDFNLEVLGLNIVNYQLFFIFAGISRFIALLLLKQVKEAKATSPSYALGIMTDYALRRLNYGKEFILNTIRFLRSR